MKSIDVSLEDYYVVLAWQFCEMVSETKLEKNNKGLKGDQKALLFDNVIHALWAGLNGIEVALNHEQLEKIWGTDANGKVTVH